MKRSGFHSYTMHMVLFHFVLYETVQLMSHIQHLQPLEISSVFHLLYLQETWQVFLESRENSPWLAFSDLEIKIFDWDLGKQIMKIESVIWLWIFCSMGLRNRTRPVTLFNLHGLLGSYSSRWGNRHPSPCFVVSLLQSILLSQKRRGEDQVKVKV